MTASRSCTSRWTRGRPRATASRSAHIPIRTCAGCGRKAASDELQRFHERDGALAAGIGPGRGVYTCRRLTCFERAHAHRGFNRTLRKTVRVEESLARLYT